MKLSTRTCNAQNMKTEYPQLKQASACITIVQQQAHFKLTASEAASVKLSEHKPATFPLMLPALSLLQPSKILTSQLHRLNEFLKSWQLLSQPKMPNSYDNRRFITLFTGAYTFQYFFQYHPTQAQVSQFATTLRAFQLKHLFIRSHHLCHARYKLPYHSQSF